MFCFFSSEMMANKNYGWRCDFQPKNIYCTHFDSIQCKTNKMISDSHAFRNSIKRIISFTVCWKVHFFVKMFVKRCLCTVSIYMLVFQVVTKTSPGECIYKIPSIRNKKLIRLIQLKFSSIFRNVTILTKISSNIIQKKTPQS